MPQKQIRMGESRQRKCLRRPYRTLIWISCLGVTSTHCLSTSWHRIMPLVRLMRSLTLKQAITKTSSCEMKETDVFARKLPWSRAWQLPVTLLVAIRHSQACQVNQTTKPKVYSHTVKTNTNLRVWNWSTPSLTMRVTHLPPLTTFTALKTKKKCPSMASIQTNQDLDCAKYSLKAQLRKSSWIAQSTSMRLREPQPRRSNQSRSTLRWERRMESCRLSKRKRIRQWLKLRAERSRQRRRIILLAKEIKMVIMRFRRTRGRLWRLMKVIIRRKSCRQPGPCRIWLRKKQLRSRLEQARKAVQRKAAQRKVAALRIRRKRNEKNHRKVQMI